VFVIKPRTRADPHMGGCGKVLAVFEDDLTIDYVLHNEIKEGIAIEWVSHFDWSHADPNLKS